MTLWGGRFEGKADPLFKRFNDSLPFDCRLVQQDIVGSIAWAKALHGAGVLNEDESKSIVKALDELAALAARDPNIVRQSNEEDVHSWVESQLIAKVGTLGKKLHTGRSRNDQVATDLRLWTREQISQRIEDIRAVQAALVTLALRELETVFPGYTHLQRAQPILFAHWCMAYFEMLDRDAARFASAARRANESPLGCGALAGTAYPIERFELAMALGFDAPCANSLDAVSDRDFVIEALAAAALTAIHLSRLAEDLILYSSAEFGLVELADAFTSGSSLMPQKKNPDALELLRGKSGRIIGAHVGFLMTVKGLPLAYNKDMQEDKQPLFDAMDNLSLCLQVLPPLLDGMKIDREQARAAAMGGNSNATDLADYLVERGVPFREAHDLTGKLVRVALEQQKNLEELPLDQMQSVVPQINKDVHVRLTVESSLNRRDAYGGTSPHRVKHAVHDAQLQLPEIGRGAVTHIRQATMDDYEAVCALVEYWAAQGENLPRNREAILEAIADFGVAIADGKVVGCGSLSIYTPKLAEIRSLGVDPSYHGGGAGAKLVKYFLEKAAELHIPKVFVLTRVPGFFGKLGFESVSIDTLPEKVKKDCKQCPKQFCCDEIAMVHAVKVVPHDG